MDKQLLYQAILKKRLLNWHTFVLPDGLSEEEKEQFIAREQKEHPLKGLIVRSYVEPGELE